MKMGVGGRRVGREREERGRKEKIRKKGKEEKKIWMPSKFEYQINNNFLV